MILNKLAISASLQNFFTKRIALILFLIIYFFIAANTYKDFGSTFDEFMVYTRGDYFYHKVVGNDKYLQKGFVINDSDNYVLHYYNSTFPALLYALNDSGSYDRYHLLNMIFGSFIFIFMYEILLASHKKWQYAILGTVVLFFIPRFLGHIPGNPKDVPFATAYIASLFFILINHKLSPFLRVLVLGICIGLTASLRFLGFSLILVYVIFLCTQVLAKKYPIRQLWEIALETMVIGVIAFTVFMASLPYIGADPYNHTIELMKINTSYPWMGTIRLFGQTYTKDSFPRLYTLLWILISTPIMILGLSVVGLFAGIFKRKQKLYMLLVISLMVQVFAYVMLKPFVYNGLRHYLFILPHLALLSVVGIIWLMKYARVFKITLGLLIIEAIFIAYTYIQIHPYEYTYFNPLVTMTRDVSREFDFDYWAASDRNALEWLKMNSDTGKPKIFVCSTSPATQIYFPEAINVGNDPKKADYIVCNDNNMVDFLQRRMKTKTLYTVKKNGQIFNTVLKVKEIISPKTSTQ